MVNVKRNKLMREELPASCRAVLLERHGQAVWNGVRSDRGQVWILRQHNSIPLKDSALQCLPFQNGLLSLPQRSTHFHSKSLSCANQSESSEGFLSCPPCPAPLLVHSKGLVLLLNKCTEDHLQHTEYVVQHTEYVVQHTEGKATF